MHFTKKEHKNFSKDSYPSFILGGDIGGTNTNLGIFGVKNRSSELLESFRFKSRELKNLHSTVAVTLSNLQKSRGISITKACLAVAGIVSTDKKSVKVTNARLSVDKGILLRKTNLKDVLLMNDFEAVGYGINILGGKGTVLIKKGRKIPKAPIIAVGAGTGLGKSTLIYDRHYKHYIPMPSEAGHSDLAAQNEFELELVSFIKKYQKAKNISYEQVLSGQGLTNIYTFLRKSGRFKESRHTKEIDKSKDKPELISKYRKIDKNCKAAFSLFRIFYARFARNLALDALPYGGVYIAGGIAPKNRGMFDRKFVKIFEESGKMRDVLKKIPVYLVLNENIGLIGAGFAGAKML